HQSAIGAVSKAGRTRAGAGVRIGDRTDATISAGLIERLKRTAEVFAAGGDEPGRCEGAVVTDHEVTEVRLAEGIEQQHGHRPAGDGIFAAAARAGIRILARTD